MITADDARSYMPKFKVGSVMERVEKDIIDAAKQNLHIVSITKYFKRDSDILYIPYLKGEYKNMKICSEVFQETINVLMDRGFKVVFTESLNNSIDICVKW